MRGLFRRQNSRGQNSQPELEVQGALTHLDYAIQSLRTARLQDLIAARHFYRESDGDSYYGGLASRFESDLRFLDHVLHSQDSQYNRARNQLFNTIIQD